MLAYLVVNYDIKLEDGKPRPEPLVFGEAVIPALDGRVMFRKRARASAPV